MLPLRVRAFGICDYQAESPPALSHLHGWRATAHRNRLDEFNPGVEKRYFDRAVRIRGDHGLRLRARVEHAVSDGAAGDCEQTGYSGGYGGDNPNPGLGWDDRPCHLHCVAEQPC